MSITLFLYSTFSGYQVTSNKDNINLILQGKSLEESIAIIKEKYPNKSITVKIYDNENNLKKIKHF